MNGLVFVDVDGTRYFRDDRGDIVNKLGELVTLTEESNVRAHLRAAERLRAAQRNSEIVQPFPKGRW